MQPPTPQKTRTLTSLAVIEAVERLHEALKATYGSNFAYTVTGKGNTLAASNQRDGFIVSHP